jgi:deoxyribose-phosphate aldolase
MIDIEHLTASKLAVLIDHTFLRPYGRPEDIHRLCQEARTYGFVSVAVNPSEVAGCVELLDGTSVKVGAAVGFPLGQNTTSVKIYEAEDAIENGAMEIDMVMNLRALQAGDTDLVRTEFAALADLCHPQGVVSKIILETCYLDDQAKELACELALEAGLDFVKTSTGFGEAGATVEDVRLMRAVVGSAMGVKAAGGIRTLDQALQMLQAGATRLGTSSGVQIVTSL